MEVAKGPLATVLRLRIRLRKRDWAENQARRGSLAPIERPDAAEKTPTCGEKASMGAPTTHYGPYGGGRT